MDHLSGGGLPSEELVIQRAVRGVELGLQEDAAIGDGFQGGGAFIGEAESNKQLDKGKQKT